MPQPSLPSLRNFVLLQHQRSLGTAIHATPLLAALRAAIPDARIAAAASGFALDLLTGDPHLERLIVTPNPMNDLRGAVGALCTARLFAGEPFAVLQTNGNERVSIGLAAMFSGGHTRVGFTTTPQLSAAPLRFDPQLSQIENNLRIVAALGHGSVLMEACARDPQLLEPRIYPLAVDIVSAHALLRQQAVDLSHPLALFVTQTFHTQRKSWRAERFCEVARWLQFHHKMQIVFVGTAEDASAIDTLRAKLDFRTASLAGSTTVRQLAAVAELATVALTLDTGPMHVFRCARVPMVVIAPAWSPPVEWLPLGNPRARILKKASMSEAPPDYVIDEVSVDDVEQNLAELLTIYPAH